jgi:REP element-mobilizing transposase RayT
MIRETSHRLLAELYKGRQTIAFTACLRNRKRYFISSEICMMFSEMLIESAKQYQCEVVIYLFMPSHCHIILEGVEDRADALTAMKRFKQKSGYWFSKHETEIKWQKDFYDHIIRTGENMRKQIEYILNNPVRNGLVEDWKNYPYVGSTIHDFKTW